jgi:hypothetical protein
MAQVSQDYDILKAVGIIPQGEKNCFTLRLKLTAGRLEVAQLLVIAAVAVDRLQEAAQALKLGGIELGPAEGRITDNRF